MTNTVANEQRIAKMARKAAKLIVGLERDGEWAAAARLRAAAKETAELMRAGRL
jgi:hypothetical protein